MSAEPIAAGIWRITTPLPFRPRQVHAYLAQSEAGRYLLVDGGIGTPEAWSALEGAVLQVAGAWQQVTDLVITHMHLDHLGLAKLVREASGARVLMGRLDSERSRHAGSDPGEEAGYRQMLLRQNGAPAELIRAVQAGAEQAATLSSFVEPDIVLDGEAGELPGVAGWRWIWTPGHTAGHISLFRAADRVFIAGDAVLPRITPTIGVNRQRDDPVGDYLHALDRVAALDPTLVLPGHGDALAEPAERLRELRQATTDESQRVLGCLSDVPATAWHVTRCRHPAADLPTATRMLAFREALAHLHHLVATGEARRQQAADAVWTFTRH